MKLNLYKRSGEKKSELTQIRYAGDIPGVVYRLRQSSEKVFVKGFEFAAIIRNLRKGFLPTTILEMELDGNKCNAIVKGIQYHPTTYNVLHLDFQLLEESVFVDVKVPVVFSGVEQCVGVKSGGFVRQVIYHIRVRCLPKDIPSSFALDISNLSIGESLRVSSIDRGDTVRLLVPEKEIIVVIAKR